MAYKNQKKNHAHVQELHRKKGLGKHKKARKFNTIMNDATYDSLMRKFSDQKFNSKPTIIGRISAFTYKLFKF